MHMKEIFVTGESLPIAYHQALTALAEQGDVLTCNDWGQMQKEVSMTYVVENPLAEPMVSRLYIGGFYELQQYVMEILDGILDFKIGDGTCWEYTYHDRYCRQLPFIINELRRNPDSRRAVMNIRDFEIDSSNSDPACLQSIQYFIRGGALHCKILMRSNDAAQANFMNAFAFVQLQKKVADELGVPVGTYTHRANSFHCYERNFKLLEQYVDGIKNKPLEEITYEYEGFYKDMMAESIPAINAAVGKLRAEMENRK